MPATKLPLRGRSCRSLPSTTDSRDTASRLVSTGRGAESVVREALDAVQKKHPTVLVKGETAYGVAGPVLSDISGGASALVVGTRGRGQIVGAVLGSTSEYVVHHAHCITTVVR
jgi:nucleotide-binding universal stress UspA family protein